MAPATSRATALAFLGMVAAQRPGTQQRDSRPPLWLQECTTGGCEWKKESVVLDANWRWAHDGDARNCYKDDTWDSTLCADPAACADNCVIEGADYISSYGITSNQFRDGVNLNFVTETEYGNNYGSRLYVMEGENKYKMFKLKNREFSIDIDVSKLTCGLNGALYFVEMDAEGDMGVGGNKAGAAYGTGYCDAQCPHDMKWIKGEANSLNWNNTHNPPIGHFGACCAEMDIWEANSMSTAYTPHPCAEPGSVKCDGVTCGDTETGQRYQGLCDKDGCDFNNYRMGEADFYGLGAGFELDSSKPFTVVTQFITVDGTDTGDLSEIKRFYLQDGKRIENSKASILGDDKAETSVTDGFCDNQKDKFGDVNDFRAKGGLKAMGEALERGMVLVLSLWDDSLVNMLWLDSMYPTDVSPRTPGVLRGPCPGGEASTPEFLRKNHPEASVEFSQIRFGAIDSTAQGARRLETEPEAEATREQLV